VRWHTVVSHIVVLALGVVVGGGIVYWRRGSPPVPPAAPTGGPQKTFTLSGEVFLQNAFGQPLRALGARVYAWKGRSGRVAEWVRLSNFEQANRDLSEKRITKEQFVEKLRDLISILDGRRFPDDPPGMYPANTECDSSGRFQLELPAGRYLLLATGQAGANVAVWMEVVDVPKTHQVSLGSPIAFYTHLPWNQ
jgi:hypothetical protein